MYFLNSFLKKCIYYQYIMSRFNTFFTVTSLFAFSINASAAERPNIVVILADDMGFSDLGCFGSEISTPNLDALATNGLRFTQFYNAARCCPTRASLLTGLHPHQAGMGHMAGGANSVPETYNYQGFLSDNAVTLAEVLKGAGYFTAHSGKWHVGNKPTTVPPVRGFDRSYEGSGFYFLTDNGGVHKINIDGVATDLRNTDDGKEWYSSYKWAEWGSKYISTAVEQQKPFFLYLAFNAPHFPLAAPDSVVNKYIGRYKNGWSELRKERYSRQKAMGLIDESFVLTPDDPNFKTWNSLTAQQKAEQDSIMATYAACVDAMDYSIGQVIKTLKAKGVYDNTIIFFLSDNGGNAEGPADGLGKNVGPGKLGSAMSDIHCGGGWANAQNTPFRQYKHYIHEGGIRTSFIAHWPAGITAKGELRKQPAHLIDIMPTLVEVSGASYPATYNGKAIIPMQGVSLVPAFTNQSLNRDTLYWEHEANRGIRIGDMKCVALVNPIRVFLPGDHDKWELYDLSVDPTEMNNLANTQPEKVKQMVALWEKWAQQKGVLPWPWGSYTPPKPLVGNVIFHYPFDGNLKDKSGNNVELQNTTDNETFFSTDSAGVHGNALALSGEPATFLEITRTGLLNPSTSDYTVCAWVKNKSDVTHHTEHIILHHAYNGAGATRYLLSCVGSGANGSDILNVGTFIGGSRNLSNGNIPRNQWTHIAIVGTHADSKLRFYINGKPDNEVTAQPFETSTQGFYVGKHKANTTDKNSANWQGLLDDLYLFNIALNQQQLNDIMNGFALPNHYVKASSASFNVFPVPASNQITVSGLEGLLKLSLLSLDQKVLKEEVANQSISVSSLPVGLYFLQIETEKNDRFVRKIIVN